MHAPFFIPGLPPVPPQFGPTGLPGRQSFGPGVHPVVAAILQQIAHPVTPPHSGQYADLRFAALQNYLNSPHGAEHLVHALRATTGRRG